jgi:hypothetical protein
MIIEPGKFYLQVVEGYVHDAVSYNPELPNYVLYEAEALPADILNRCYELVDGELVRDEEKYADFLIEVEKAREEWEASRKQLEEVEEA